MIARIHALKRPTRRITLLFSALLSLLAALLVAIACAWTPAAYGDGNLKSANLTVGSGSNAKTYDVAKQVVTLEQGSKDSVTLEINDDSPSSATRTLNKVDSSGKETKIVSDSKTKWTIPIKDFEGSSKIVLKATNGNSTLYEKQLNIRVVDAKKAENAVGQSQSSNWSFSNGLQYTFKNTGFKFLDGTTFNLNAVKLPIIYKHEADGTTIAGINCTPEDRDFFLACKNGNVWQKYSTDALAEKIKQADKGWDGKKLGTWGGKKMDWTICGYMQYNTNNPKAPRSVNLVISCGISASGHAQYLIFTGTLTFTAGGKAMLTGSLTPMPDGSNKVSGKFGLGGYGGLELYIGVGLNYVASVGAYGKGTINVDFQILPEFFLEKTSLDGSVGVKAKVFGFTVATWQILSGHKDLYKRASGKNLPTSQSTTAAAGNTDDAATSNPDGTAMSMTSVSADTAYPVDSRDYLEGQSVEPQTVDTQNQNESAPQSDTPLMAQSESLSAAEVDAGVIRSKTYGETELDIVDTNNGPVMVYAMDANQIDGAGQRTDINRSALVYSRRSADGSWSNPIMIDSSSESKDFADYSPSITTDGTNCYVAWLAADSEIADGATLGDVGKKLDVKIATIGPNDGEAGNVAVETVKTESDDETSVPASPKAVKANGGLYVGWHTNAATGSNGEILGLAGEHDVILSKKEDANWVDQCKFTTNSGAVTSFDVGTLGDTAICAFSFDPKFKENADADALGAYEAIKDSTVYLLKSDGGNNSLETATGATNVQFAKKNNQNVLTYAKYLAADDNGGPYLSIMSKNASNAAEVTELDGKSVSLPTTGYRITGDLAQANACNVSFICSTNGTSDVQALVRTGTGATNWSNQLAATSVSDTVMDYAPIYVDGKPFFVYSTAAATSGLTTAAQDDGSVSLNQSTANSLTHFNVDDVSYDEIAYKSGSEMPVTATLTNDGMIPADGADIYVYENETPRKIASVDKNVAVGETTTVTFNYKLPDKDSITKAQGLVLYAAAKGDTVTKEDILLSKDDDSSFGIGGPFLVLDAEHLLEDGQESVKVTVTNKGMVSQGATLVFEQSVTGDDLKRVEVPALGEDETFEYSYAAPSKYFRKSGIEDMTVMLENGGSSEYAISNTDFISTWELSDSTQPMFRLYNPNSGEHFYTASVNERDYLVGLGWRDEGTGWTAPVSSDTPVFRLYNANGGEHHYTTDATERDSLIAAGWNDEGIGWYSDDAKGQVLYREYNPNQFSCNHNYTASKDEHDWLVSLGWHDEGTAWYGTAQ